MGEYWCSDCISACSWATIRSTTSVSFDGCWGNAVRGSAHNASATGNIFKARIMPPKLCIRDPAGLCQSRPAAAPRKLYKRLVQGQAYLKTDTLDEMSGLRSSNSTARDSSDKRRLMPVCLAGVGQNPARVSVKPALT